MREWLIYRDEFQQAILARDALSSMSCDTCQSTTGALYRCQDCFASPVVCHYCCLSDHLRQPFHNIQKWTGLYFASSSLHELGFVLHLGHGGSKCSGTIDEWEDVEMEDVSRGVPIQPPNFTVVDIGGVYSHTVHWCQCLDAEEKRIQLLRMGLYPASVKQPKTAFTFRLLEYFHLDTLECNTSAFNFYHKLRRLTNKYQPEIVAVSSPLLGKQLLVTKVQFTG